MRPVAKVDLTRPPVVPLPAANRSAVVQVVPYEVYETVDSWPSTHA